MSDDQGYSRVLLQSAPPRGASATCVSCVVMPTLLRSSAARDWCEGCVAHCDVKPCADRVVMVVETGDARMRVQRGYCQEHGVSALTLPAAERVRSVAIFFQ